MNKLLEKHPSYRIIQSENRRRTFERRQSLPSFKEVYRWYSAIAIKLGGVIMIAILAVWLQKSLVQEHPSGASSTVAAYQWDGYHRVGAPSGVVRG